MVTTKKELKQIISIEKEMYFRNTSFFRESLLKSRLFCIWKFQKRLRKTEYFYNKYKKNKTYLFLYIFSKRKLFSVGNKYNLEIGLNTFDIGLQIYHFNIVVNGNCRFGKNCKLHGGNCIGNKGAGRTNEFPSGGNSIDFGYGAVVIGDIYLSDDTVIGANSLVNKSTLNKQIVGGVPAKGIYPHGGDNE